MSTRSVELTHPGFWQLIGNSIALAIVSDRLNLRGERYAGNTIQGAVEAAGCLLARSELFIGWPDLSL
jgi:hypothetical protein